MSDTPACFDIRDAIQKIRDQGYTGERFVIRCTPAQEPIVRAAIEQHQLGDTVKVQVIEPEPPPEHGHGLITAFNRLRATGVAGTITIECNSQDAPAVRALVLAHSLDAAIRVDDRRPRDEARLVHARAGVPPAPIAKLGPTLEPYWRQFDKRPRRR